MNCLLLFTELKNTNEIYKTRSNKLSDQERKVHFKNHSYNASSNSKTDSVLSGVFLAFGYCVY